MKNFIKDPINIFGIVMGLFAGSILILAMGCPIKNSTRYFDIPEWGKYTCVKNTDWWGKNERKECWLLEMEPKMIEFIETYNKTK